MKTIEPLSECGLPFEFASIQFPKYVWTLPRGPMAKRLAQAKANWSAPYYHAPTPNQGKGIGFYLDSDGMPQLRWQWCDEVTGVRINHSGWYSDEFGDAEKIRGVVFRLPHSRGFLAGWSMGEGMASAIEYGVHESETDAARAADSIAENVAESEREYQESERQKEREQEKRELSQMAEEIES